MARRALISLQYTTSLSSLLALVFTNGDNETPRTPDQSGRLGRAPGTAGQLSFQISGILQRPWPPLHTTIAIDPANASSPPRHCVVVSDLITQSASLESWGAAAVR